MFDLAVVPPSVPRESSERAAEAMHKSGAAKTQAQRILDALFEAGCVPGSVKYLSRDDLMERTGMREGSINGRTGPSSGLTIEKRFYDPASCQIPVVATEDAATSHSGNSVIGFQLTTFGMRFFAGRGR